MIGAAADLRGVAADDVLSEARGKPWGDRRDVVQVLRARRQRVEQVLRHHRLLAHVLGVDQRRRATHRDRFRDSANLEVRIHRSGEARRQLDAVPLDRTETGDGERDDVRARPQIDDVVPPLAVGDDDADLFDEHRTGGFHRDPWKHGTRCVSDGPRDAAGRLLGPRAR